MPPIRCFVASCGVKKEDAGPGVLFFTFPKRDDLRESWIVFTQREKRFQVDSARICSSHFIPALDYKSGYTATDSLPRGFRLLKDDALPRLNPDQDWALNRIDMKRESDIRVKALL